MARLIVAGISQGVVQRHKGAYQPELDGWEVILCHSMKFKSDLRSCWSDVLTLANQAPIGGTHIFAFHYQESARPDFERDVYARHRLIWLQQSSLADYGTERFTNTLREVARFEEEWRASLRPEDVRAALILPEKTFEARPNVDALWKRAQKVRRGSDDVLRVSKLMERFRTEHYLKGCWIDLRGRRFDPGGARHALHVPTERHWKYTFRVPDGFHFDVSREGSDSFSLRDCEGTVYDFRRHTNVDCHGYVRGGE